MLQNIKPFNNYQFVSIEVNATNARYYFPDLPNLRDALVTGIVFYPPAVSATNPNSYTASVAYLNGYLTLNSKGEEFIQKMELARLITISQEGKFYPFGLTNLPSVNIAFDKSYVEIASGVAAPVATSCFQFGIYYNKPGQGTVKPKIGY